MTLVIENNNFLNSFDWLTAIYSSPKNTNLNLAHPGFHSLEMKINYQFKDKNLIKEALTHKTYSFENDLSRNESYEKKELLGDSFINFVVSERIYNKFENLSEGEISKLRGSLVNEATFSKLAKFLELNLHVILGRGEFKNDGFNKPSILADVFESLFGAILLDSNFEVARKVFLNVIEKYEQENGEYFNVQNILDFDEKSKLQELLIKKFKLTPEYTHKMVGQMIEVSLKVSDMFVHSEVGKNKREVEKKLAKLALDYFNKQGDENVTN